jgi:hypothetical protein
MILRGRCLTSTEAFLSLLLSWQKSFSIRLVVFFKEITMPQVTRSKRTFICAGLIIVLAGCSSATSFTTSRAPS